MARQPDSQSGNRGFESSWRHQPPYEVMYLSFLVGPGHVLKLPFPSLKTSRGIATGSLPVS